MSDFSLTTATSPIQPTIVTIPPDETGANRVVIKLSGSQRPQTLAANDLTWRATGLVGVGPPRPSGGPKESGAPLPRGAGTAGKSPAV
ncbi:MAG: hypothetical protein WDO68_02820 [Gammaproteobacteria bacterium]